MFTRNFQVFWHFNHAFYNAAFWFIFQKGSLQKVWSNRRFISVITTIWQMPWDYLSNWKASFPNQQIVWYNFPRNFLKPTLASFSAHNCIIWIFFNLCSTMSFQFLVLTNTLFSWMKELYGVRDFLERLRLRMSQLKSIYLRKIPPPILVFLFSKILVFLSNYRQWFCCFFFAKY